MKFHVPALLALVTASFAFSTGCGATVDDDSNLSTSEEALLADDQEASDAEEDVEVGLDQPLSGADPTAPSEAPTAADFIVNIRKNPGRFFTPAGCLTSTFDEANKTVTHVFNDCTGPHGLKTYNGTVVTTWRTEDRKLIVRNSSTDFHINGKTISGYRELTFSRQGSVITRTRVGDWSGTTGKGAALEHDANFTVTYDLSTKCLTRNGTATTKKGNKTHTRTVVDYEVCGVEFRGCPKAGKVSLKNGENELDINYQGGSDVEISRPKKGRVFRKLVCVERRR
ncbi:MAG: hypothetical protein U0174_00575 [Polyangiaceae bacterium]